MVHPADRVSVFVGFQIFDHACDGIEATHLARSLVSGPVVVISVQSTRDVHGDASTTPLMIARAAIAARAAPVLRLVSETIVVPNCDHLGLLTKKSNAASIPPATISAAFPRGAVC